MSKSAPESIVKSPDLNFVSSFSSDTRFKKSALLEAKLLSTTIWAILSVAEPEGIFKVTFLPLAAGFSAGLDFSASALAGLDVSISTTVAFESSVEVAIAPSERLGAFSLEVPFKTFSALATVVILLSKTTPILQLITHTTPATTASIII